MTRLSRFLLCISASVLLLSCAERDRYVTITGFAQGGTYAVKFNTRGVEVSPEEIRDSVAAILDGIDKSLSGYNRNSLVSRFNAGETVIPDRYLADLYSLSYHIYEETEGVVDVASAPLFDIWGFGFKEGRFPSEEDVEAVLSRSGLHRMKSDMAAPVSGSSMLKEGETVLPELNFNAVAQGYSCDVVAGYLYSVGVKDMMVDIGEIFCDGMNPSGKPWTVGIDRPADGNEVPGSRIQGIFRVPDGPHGVVTSGNYRKFYVKGGRKYAHTIDPRTGYPVSHNLLSATVVASDAMTADAYATYCMVVGLEEAKDFLASRTDISGCLVYDDCGVFATWCSEGFVLEEPATSSK